MDDNELWPHMTTHFWWELTVQLERDMSQAASSAESAENSKSDTQSGNNEIPTEGKSKWTKLIVNIIHAYV